ncbi:amidohydrolase family protein [Flavobacterium sp. ACN6]|uniref:amidohydrolase family protein n=1 Tax=Flavobacterium sp. ACN6 TaxID=1920426 RepID=UPI000BB2D282|nr:amidohydrolase family protein [Flavobacterium sp. ACN6]PBJ08081.1 Amidohydrolase [Flavobacterium sp. ACN6]
MEGYYKNSHTHIFTMNNAPKDFLRLFLPPFLADATDNFTNTELGAWIIRTIASRSGGKAKRYAAFLKIGKNKFQEDVFEDLMSRYQSEGPFQFVTLCQNLEYLGVGRSVSGFEGQLEEVIKIKRKFPFQILPFFGLDPRWKSSGDEIQKTVARYFNNKIEMGETEVYPFQGLKIYPSTGHYAFDERLKKTFEWAALHGVPVMTHAYYLGGLYNFDKNYIINNLNPVDPYTGLVYHVPKFLEQRGNFKSRMLGTQKAIDCKNNCSYFLEPDSYRTMLDKIAGLKICFAHFGGVDQIKAALGDNTDSKKIKPFGVSKTNWYEQIKKLMTDYPEQVYTDISYDITECLAKENHMIYDEFYEQAKKYPKQILFGTDFFMTERDGLEQNAVKSFKDFAMRSQLLNGNSMWEQMAKVNPDSYLKSKYNNSQTA